MREQATSEQRRSTGSDERRRERFFAQAGPHLDRLRAFVDHELAYFAAVGDLVPGELTTDDVVDAVLVRAYEDFARKPAVKSVRGWLIRLAIEHLEGEVKRARAQRRRAPVHIEDHVPETASSEVVSTLGDEILDFYVPDEDWKLEDVIPDLDIPTPEQEAETREVRQCVAEALTRMPRLWRRAVWLHHAEGLSLADVARVIERSPGETRRILDHARAHLRQKLLEARCALKDSDG
jgi:RNA polymerase sigma factor (sigma-70 family)